MSFRRYNIESLIQNGKRLIPWKIEILYRYISAIEEVNQAYVDIYGSMYEANPVVLCSTDKLYIPTELEGGMTKFTTELINISDKVETGIYFDLYNAQYLEIKRISVLYREASVSQGHDGIGVDSVSILSFSINGGDLSTDDPLLTLTNTVAGTPTEYRLGKLADVSDGLWTAYSASFAYSGDIGDNTFYLQVRNSDGYLSNIKSASIVVIATQFLQDIDDLRNTLDADFVLERDLDFDLDSSYDQTDVDWQTKKTAWTTGTGFPPIETFAGTFDGAGFSISNMFIDRGAANSGLFGRIDGATIENLVLNSVSINTIFSAHGALVGYCLGGTITNCHCSGVIGDVGSYVGGLIGDIRGATTISKCSSSCNITGGIGVGGLVGQVFTIELVDIDNCYSTGDVIGSQYVGGMLGYSQANSVLNCYSAGLVNGGSSYGGFSATTCGIDKCYYDTNTSYQSDNDGRGVPKTTAEMKLEATYVDWNFTTIWQITTNNYPTLR